jgi:hypothetical protein
VLIIGNGVIVHSTHLLNEAITYGAQRHKLSGRINFQSPLLIYLTSFGKSKRRVFYLSRSCGTNKKPPDPTEELVVLKNPRIVYLINGSASKHTFSRALSPGRRR